MLKTQFVVALVAIIAAVIIASVFLSAGNRSSTTTTATTSPTSSSSSTTTTSTSTTTTTTSVPTSTTTVKPKLLGTSCTPYHNYNCTGDGMTLDGYLNLTIGENGIVAIYNIRLACSAASNATYGNPLPTNSVKLIAANGTAENVTFTGQMLSLVSNQTAKITGLPCYMSNQKQFNDAYKTALNAYLWINYTKSSGIVTKQNPVYSFRFANITVLP